jgi:hypothetical protein
MHLALSILGQHSAPTSLHDAATDCVTSLLARLEREASLGTYYSTFQQCCGTVTMYCGSGSYFAKVSVPYPVSVQFQVTDPDHIWHS